MKKLWCAFTLVTLLVVISGCAVPTAAPVITPTQTQPPQKPTATASPDVLPTSTTAPLSPSTTPLPTLGAVEMPVIDRVPGFASLYESQGVQIPENYQGTDYTLPLDLMTVSNVVSYTFSPGQLILLQQNGFVAAPADWLEFFQLYEQARYQDAPVFVTVDSIYHVYHLLFDKLLRELERQSLSPTLVTLTDALVETSRVQYEQSLAATDPATSDAARKVWGYFVVAQQLLSENPPSIPDPVADDVKRELALIAEHKGIDMSPLLSLPEAFAQGLGCDPDASPEEAEKFYCEDYSQYVPRGHYTRDEQLQRYFRAMMWYGRINLRLKHVRETRMALLMTRAIRQTAVAGMPATQLWASIYDPTVFLVGKSDDLSFHEYGPLMDAVYGTEPDLALFGDNERLAAFIELARQLPPPQINSMWVYIWEDEEEATQGFRFMGQRFVLDAYVFEQLIWREVGVMGNERWLPKGLDVFAAMGNQNAYVLLDEMGETAYPRYDEQMAKVQQEIASLEMDSWTQNLYWYWLYSLQAVTAPKGDSYPAFMRNWAWASKDLHTALGSWTELKHDTILYAKQVMAELGGGGMIVEPPQGYVEPNPEAYARLLSLTRMTQTGLAERGILPDTMLYAFSELDDMLVFLQDIAQRELLGTPLTADEYERIKFYGGWLENMTMMAADIEEDTWANEFSEDEQAALVADVATDPRGSVLEEAIGRIYEIYVVVPDGRGNLQIVKGGIFSYYEFEWPMEQRLTNEVWRTMIAEGRQPAQPDWTRTFIVE